MFNNSNYGLNGIKTLAIVCNQWGDTGKGKFVDLFSEWADIIARGTGGDNAGHTICLNGKSYISHIIPSGILWDKQGKINIIGSGCAFNPRIAEKEILNLSEEGYSFKNLMISQNVKLILPQNVVIDRLTGGKIGTTGRGIGSVYTDHYSRIGLTANDLLNPDIFKKKLITNLEDKIRFIKTFAPNEVEKIISDNFLENGLYYNSVNIFNIQAIIARYMEYGLFFKDMIFNTDKFMRDNVKKKNILLEGAQGLLLSIDKGTYPFVTSSDCSAYSLARGAGLKYSEVDLTLGVVKFPYMTRVGEGPFPTEMGGETSARWCGNKVTTKELEETMLAKVAYINSPDSFHQGVAIRIAGNEYGATTKRPRRTGWIDLPLLRYAIAENGPELILTKIDVLNFCYEINICIAYIYQGPKFYYGELILCKGDTIEIAIPSAEIMNFCEPVYQKFHGWNADIKNINNFQDLPENLINIINFIEEKTGANIRIISTGADREKTIFINKKKFWT